MKRKKILWISRYVAYDTVRHAGGQNFNYYLKQMSKEDFDICMVAFCNKEEIQRIDSEKYGIKSHVFCMEDEYAHLKQKYINLEVRYSPFNRHGNFCDNYVAKKILKYTKNLKSCDYPDVVILHWTEIGLLAFEIKRLLPNSRLIIIEEDVAFLGLQRSVNNTKSLFLKSLKRIKYSRLKKAEVKQLSYADEVFTTNYKDRDLLIMNGIKRVNVLSSYYYSMSHTERERIFTGKIIFFGAMNREENYKAALWFIERVFVRLNENWEFFVIGNKPPEELMKYKSSKIHITGFVDTVDSFFEQASCFVAPLLTGAGIKIKILEAMSSGTPILTNSIGIEGIPAKDRESYFHCDTPEDYMSVLNEIERNYGEAYRIGMNGKKIIRNNFNYENSFKRFRQIVCDGAK